MKIIKSILLCVIIVLLVNNLKVNAQIKGKLTREYKDGYYYVMSGENYYRSFEIPFYSLENYIVYCIEPGVKINTWNYVGEYGFINSPYNEEINKKLELIGHYGYGYFNHDTLNYQIATQALIWEITGKKKVEFFTKQYGYGDVIDVSYEKNKIMKLVNNHYVVPSFNNEMFVSNINDEIVLEDENNVLEDFEVYEDGGNTVKQDGNKLYIKINKVGNSKVKLRRKKYDKEESIVFVGEDDESQKVGFFRLKEDITSLVNLNGIGARVKIIKVDAKSFENIKKEGIKFKIKNLDDNSYVCETEECIFETDENGEVITKSFLVGNYQIEELELQDLGNYLWNSQPLKFTIDNNSKIIDNIYEVKFENQKVTGSIEINKKGEIIVYENNTYRYEKIALSNVLYGLYANEDIYKVDKILYSKGELIETIKTNENGIAYLEGLELGSYYIKELSSSMNNMVDETKYYFELKYKDKYTEVVNLKFNFENNLPKGKLIFIKTDEETSYPLENTLIKIYNSLDNSIIYSGYTDKQGIIEVEDLPLGEYYIKEIESPKGYELSNEILGFEIKRNNEVVKVKLTNKVIIDIPNTMLNEIDYINLLGLIFIFIGIALIVYVKKK